MNLGLIGKILIAIGVLILLGARTADYTGLSQHEGLGRGEIRWLVGGLVACVAGFVLLKRSAKST